ncbi:hypothetical protein FCR2A7T_13440 [Flavobacterium cauense R2A-7]|uniref:Uncharacterized protein n=1 Tax=Flavobacterium cauense R2A-7 TaxID=1341154 RepID=V6RZS7_9FLAO|nr:hypothetical protein [Flavobacterium cauense]ESU19938.1 hypothetical protein FCR2A7T_13440 [Flavobacterium cauense R2A-7]KGO83744.1 hypothetical protein Q762_00400 [Flavobacterium cauense R2A-7]TWI12360.1 hypothetical protein IP98_01572 [Flavobacterium cauense R2A-7]
MSLKLTEGIYSNIYSSLYKSIEKNNIESVQVINTFIRKVLSLSIKNESLKQFNEYIDFPNITYYITHSEFAKNNSLEKLYLRFSRNCSMTLKEIIWYNISFHERKHSDDLQKLVVLNDFYYSTYKSFSKLLYYMVKNTDFTQFKFAIEEIEQISDERNTFGLRNQLFYNPHIEIVKKEKIEQEYNIRIQPSNYRRHLLTGIKYWIFFLFNTGKIDASTTLKFISEIKIYYYDPEESLSDILFFRSNQLYGSRYMGWEDWDYTERRSGKVYSPPMPSDWLVLGFLIEQIRGNVFSVNPNKYSKTEIQDSEFLLDRLKHFQSHLVANIDKWKEILNVKNEEELNKKAGELISKIALLKRVNKSQIENEIAGTKLSLEKINSFKESVAETWKSTKFIRNLFDFFNASKLISDDTIKLKNIGQHLFFERAKMMFIDGKNYQEIYGMNDMGSRIARWENDLFFNYIAESEVTTLHNKELVKILDDSISELKNRGFIPSLILIPYGYRYDKNAFVNNPLFVPKTESNIEDKFLKSEFAGKYDNISVFKHSNSNFRNKILVCDLKSTIVLKYKTNDNWEQQHLYIDVKEIDDDEAKKKFDERPDYWSNQEDGIAKLDEKDALILIKTSVIIDYWSTMDFEILDKNACIIGSIVSEQL